MLTQEQRATMSAMWLARWRSWQGSGISMAEYARREGFDADGAYRWRRVLRRRGQWGEADGAPAVSTTVTVKKGRPAPRFARVTVSDARSASILLRIVLVNGRRAELEIGNVMELGKVIGVLERAA